MPFSPQRFSDCLLKITGKAPPEILAVRLNEFHLLKSPVKQAEFIRVLMEDLTQQLPETGANSVMQMCGMYCIGNSIIEKAKRLYKKSENTGDFLSKLNRNKIGGGNLYPDGNTIVGSYNNCYCGSISKSKKGIPLTYCYCTTGWLKKLFEEVLCKPVWVKILQSIASGSPKCVFKIHI